MKAKKRTGTIIYHILVCGFGLLMLYPLFWMFMSSFKGHQYHLYNSQKSDPGSFYSGKLCKWMEGICGGIFCYLL